DLLYIAGINGLKRLHFCSVTNAGKVLRHIGHMPALYAFGVNNCRIGLNDFKCLESLLHLTDLDLSECTLSRTELRMLGHLGGLRALDLSDTDVSNDSLGFVKRLGTLESLDLSRTFVSGESVRLLKGLTKPKFL